MPLKQKHSDKKWRFLTISSDDLLLAAVRLSVPMFSFGVIFFVDLGNRFYMDSGETEIIVE